MLREKCRRLVNRIWYGEAHFLPYLLLPFSAIFHLCTKLRKAFLLYQQVPSAGLPVIVVGNLVVGGTGKTPLVCTIVDQLKAKGRNPGIASRGYGAKRHDYPYRVQTDSALEAGDEPVLLKEKTGCPVVIDPNRTRAVKYLSKHCGVDVAICDDGLQHYRLHRDVEIALVDGAVGLGNGLLLPAGPLREPRSRLNSVDLVVINGEHKPHSDLVGNLAQHKLFSTRVVPLRFQNLATGTQLPVDGFSGRTVHGCAGIARPERFFAQLRALGATVIPHTYPDHHHYRKQDLCFNLKEPVIITGKDAVKCRCFANDNIWVLEIEMALEERFWRSLDKCLSEISQR